MQIFEGLARQQGDLVLLQRRIKYDRLGVNDALLQFESDMDHRLLPEPERLLPVLDQIARIRTSWRFPGPGARARGTYPQFSRPLIIRRWFRPSICAGNAYPGNNVETPFQVARI